MRKIKEIQLIIFFSQCWHTLKWVSTVYICLTGWTSSVLCLIGVNPVVAVSNNSNNTSALNCQQLLPGALYLCAPQHYQALENTVFFRPLYSGWPLGVILWAFPRYSQHTHTYIQRKCVWIVLATRGTISSHSSSSLPMVSLRIYLHIVEKKVNKRFNDIT